MSIIRPLILLAAIGTSLDAAEVVVAGGKSPDGKFEVMLSERAEPPACFVRCTRSHASLSNDYYGGYAFRLSAAANESNTSSLWNGSSTMVAIKQRGTKWSSEVTLLRLTNDRFVEIKLPELYPAVLKEIGVATIYRRAFTSPLRWINGSTLVLKLEGDCDLPGLKPEESRRWFEYEAIIDLANTNSPSIKRLALKDHNG
jgi:hypothetical protein